MSAAGCCLPPKRARAVVPCPSEAAYQRAVRRKRKPCAGCRAARAAYERARGNARRVVA